MFIQRNVPLAPYTTFKVGGPAAFFVEASSTLELISAVSYARERSLRIFIIGGGSNVLIPDEGIDGLVIQISIKGIEDREVGDGVIEVEAAAGEVWDDLVSFAVSRGWSGIENLSCIPGTVGAAPIQNIGAYGVEFCDVVKWVEAIDLQTLKPMRLSASECRFTYRDSIFKREGSERFVVTKVCIILQASGALSTSYRDLKEHFGDTQPTLSEVREAVTRIRAQKFPDLRKTGTAGSFFKNPILSDAECDRVLAIFPELPHYKIEAGVKVPIAYILEALGWKGRLRGSVGVHDAHALVLVNHGSGTYEDIDALAREIECDVKEKTGIELEREVMCAKR